MLVNLIFNWKVNNGQWCSRVFQWLYWLHLPHIGPNSIPNKISTTGMSSCFWSFPWHRAFETKGKLKQTVLVFLSFCFSLLTSAPFHLAFVLTRRLSRPPYVVLLWTYCRPLSNSCYLMIYAWFLIWNETAVFNFGHLESGMHFSFPSDFAVSSSVDWITFLFISAWWQYSKK